MSSGGGKTTTSTTVTPAARRSGRFYYQADLASVGNFINQPYQLLHRASGWLLRAR